MRCRTLGGSFYPESLFAWLSRLPYIEYMIVSRNVCPGMCAFFVALYLSLSLFFPSLFLTLSSRLSHTFICDFVYIKFNPIWCIHRALVNAIYARVPSIAIRIPNANNCIPQVNANLSNLLCVYICVEGECGKNAKFESILSIRCISTLCFNFTSKHSNSSFVATAEMFVTPSQSLTRIRVAATYEWHSLNAPWSRGKKWLTDICSSKRAMTSSTRTTFSVRHIQMRYGFEVPAEICQ